MTKDKLHYIPVKIELLLLYKMFVFIGLFIATMEYIFILSSGFNTPRLNPSVVLTLPCLRARACFFLLTSYYFHAFPLTNNPVKTCAAAALSYPYLLVCIFLVLSDGRKMSYAVWYLNVHGFFRQAATVSEKAVT